LVREFDGKYGTSSQWLSRMVVSIQWSIHLHVFALSLPIQYVWQAAILFALYLSFF